MSESQIHEAVQAPQSSRRKGPGLAVLIAAAALGVAGWQFYSTQQQLDSMRQELARRLAEGSGAGKEQRAVAEQAMLAARATDGKLALLEARFNEAAGQYATLNGMYQELTKNRTDWLLSETEHSLAVANQQLQLAGNVSAAVSALEMVDGRLAKFDRPQLIAVKKAVATDLEKLKALPYLDTVGLTVKIDRLMLGVDALPLAVDAHRLGGSQAAAASAPLSGAPWWERLSAEISQSLGELIHIRRMDKPEALLLSPEQAFFLRENLKMRLLDARLALLQRDGKTYAADVAAARSYVQRYFDRDAGANTQWLSTLSELEGAPLDISLPDMSASLKAVRDAQGNREE
ncbi:uroporphyrinogen-III C-methyltransferase [Chromobacterium sp. IIBBL 290-4]|uniref:uroporphyrinogen-III C-methyltransferase n=1 Tax=Chromobacterium sp. IIBBL 290-4 TaxID=2953890 RepID=UPI0020B7628A|nr:uroporphyrinogen-III C-methyltransferase [Chromobacterium sp. IIBBL 290-4]UTH75862.1 uroporphyrinogen-III C-methyltransferase [Chromobacterium sp. IIBBL 290-4]